MLRDVSPLARACAERADAIIRKLMVESDLRLSTFQPYDIEKELKNASTQAMRDIQDVLELFHTRAKLRALSGINSNKVTALLAEREHYLKPAENMLDGILEVARTTRACAHDAEQVKARLAGIARRMEMATQDVRDTVQVSRLSERDAAEIEDKIAEIKRERRNISRSLAQENSAVKLSIPEDIVTILQKHRIV